MTRLATLSRPSPGGRGVFIVLILLFLFGCGKEAAPLPPFIRIPESVKDLKATQSGHDLVLTWTNPARNIDGSAATNLSRAEIRTGDSILATPAVAAPGELQSFSIPLDPGLGGQRTFTVVIDTTQGKKSAVSNSVSVTPVEVPGAVSQLHAIVDQRRIRLQWDKPVEHPELADGYIITRSDMPAEPHFVPGTSYEDDQYQLGKTLTYQVTSVRRVGGNTLPGTDPQSISVVVEDKTPPQSPAGLDIVQTDTGAYLTWNPDLETDLAGYRIFRSDTENGDFRPISDRVISTNAFFDPSYRLGEYYRVSAVDEFGNESAMSDPLQGP